jgi:hypothetical protein
MLEPRIAQPSPSGFIRRKVLQIMGLHKPIVDPFYKRDGSTDDRFRGCLPSADAFVASDNWTEEIEPEAGRFCFVACLDELGSCILMF